jgi:hypothetical protein
MKYKLSISVLALCFVFGGYDAFAEDQENAKYCGPKSGAVVALTCGGYCDPDNPDDGKPDSDVAFCDVDGTYCATDSGGPHWVYETDDGTGGICGTNWEDISGRPGYQQTKNQEGCAKGLFRCAEGYFGRTSDGTTGCYQCPEYDGLYTNSQLTTKARGTSVAGTTYAGGCYLPSGTYYNMSGTMVVQSGKQCYYSTAYTEDNMCGS